MIDMPLESVLRDGVDAPATVPEAGDDLGLLAPDPVFSGLAEMLRSFVVLADTLNLSHAVDRLQTTRQTVRRHIKLLEERRGAALFELRDRQYVLTTAGKRALPEAEYILARAQGWYTGAIERINGLDSIRRWKPHPYLLQQQSMASLWTSKCDLLIHGAKAWAEAGGDLEHRSLQALRRNMVLFRRVGEDWVCAEVGPESAFATWYGWRWEKSSIGLPLGKMPGGRTFSRIANRPYDEIEASGGLRYDHIHTKALRGEEAVIQPLSFKRLLMGCRFADQTFALGLLVIRSYSLNIDGVDPEIIRSLPEDLVEEN
jgi:hypothetical protein